MDEQSLYEALEEFGQEMGQEVAALREGLGTRIEMLETRVAELRTEKAELESRVAKLEERQVEIPDLEATFTEPGPTPSRKSLKDILREAFQKGLTG